MALVNTIHGEMDVSLLEKKEGTVDNENETTNWVEYWLDGEIVHRSVDMKLKSSVLGTAIAASIA